MVTRNSSGRTLRVARDATGSQTARWSQRVTQDSKAPELEPGVSTLDDPRCIAASLRRSAERSTRRHSEPFRLAMSMLNFYSNRAGRQLDPDTQARLLLAKDELRVLFNRPRQSGLG